MKTDRRSFIKSRGALLGLASLSTYPGKNNLAMAQPTNDLFFKISLVEWSFVKALFSQTLTNMCFPAKAKNDFGIQAVEYVNQFFKDKAEDETYLSELKSRTTDLNVENVLIMIDGEGALAETDDAKRKEAVEHHYKWVEAAKFLGCHSIRVNAYTSSNDANAAKLATVDGLSRLVEFATPYCINIIVGNLGGVSSNGQWLADVMRQVNKPNCGTLPDFSNFCIKSGSNGCEEMYDRYQGLTELMPFAKGVSAITGAFDADGNDVDIDYMKMMKIVKDAGYLGHVGIWSLWADEDQAIRLTKALLEKVGKMV